MEPSKRRRGEEALRGQQAALMELTRSKTIRTGNLGAALREITEAAARTLGVARVSVWMLNEARTAIHLVDLYEAGSHRHSDGLELAASQFPSYFAELLRDRVIEADEAGSDPRTSEFRDSYLAPLGITSMLDAPIRLGGEIVGVVCHEHIGPKRRWRIEEQHFASSMANLVSLALEASGRRRAEEALRVAEERTHLILDNAYDAFVAIDARGHITDWNRQAELIFGWSREEAMGRELSLTIIPPEHRAAHIQGMSRYLAGRPGTMLNRRIEITACRRDGTEFPVELSIRHQRVGTDDRFNAFIADISERKKGEQELLKAKEAAEAASRAKSEFLASMSHEIRTPMNAIIGMADLLIETPLSDEQRQYVEISRRAGATLLDLVNDLLDLSKVEAGQLELESLPFDLVELIDRTVEMLAVLAHEKGLELISDIAPDVPRGVVGDANRLRQVLVNLTHNAIKFTESGEVILRVERAPGLAGPGGLRFSVTDTGVGIPDDKLETIFERFAQVDSSPTRRHGGTGLGLTISRQLVELMGGRLEVRSQVGAGSCFAFTVHLVPHERAQATPPGASSSRAVSAPSTPPESPPRSGPVPAARMRQLKVLLVEDSSDNRVLIQSYLKKMPIEIDVAENGARAVERFREGRYDLVLMDMQMPVLNGYDATRAIRDWERETSRPPTPIIALTAYALEQDAAKCLEAGCTMYVSKPIRKTELIAAIFEHTAKVETAPEPVATGSKIIVKVDPEIADLIPAFLENRRQDIASMRIALERSDYEEIRFRGHRMNGCGAGFGFDAVSSIGHALDRAAASRDDAEIRSRIDELSDYLDRLELR